MKKIIAVVLCLALVMGVVIAKVNYDKTHFVGYYYVKGEEYDTGIAKGNVWHWTGETDLYSLDEIRDMATYCRMSLTGFMDGYPAGVAVTLLSDRAVIFPGLDWDQGISNTWYLTL